MNLVRFYFLPIFVSFFSCAAVMAAQKECSEKISPDFQKVVEHKFSKLRIPQLIDLDSESIGFDIKDGGDGCFSVAVGDFDGDNNEDVAVLLISKSNSSVHLVVGLHKHKSWKISQLPTFCDNIKYCYVKVQKPGTYVRSAALNTMAKRKNEYSKLVGKNVSVLSGKLESTGIVYVLSNHQWSYVWVSD